MWKEQAVKPPKGIGHAEGTGRKAAEPSRAPKKIDGGRSLAEEEEHTLNLALAGAPLPPLLWPVVGVSKQPLRKPPLEHDHWM